MSKPYHMFEVGPPAAAPAVFPYPGHRTMAEVMVEELPPLERRRVRDRERYDRERRSVWAA